MAQWVEVERKNKIDKANMEGRVKELLGWNVSSSTGGIKSKKRTLKIEKGKILQRSSEYVRELFHNGRETDNAKEYERIGNIKVRSKMQFSWRGYYQSNQQNYRKYRNLIYYTKLFDNVWHIEILRKVDLHGQISK